MDCHPLALHRISETPRTLGHLWPWLSVLVAAAGLSALLLAAQVTIN
jgi:hypothetical protein